MLVTVTLASFTLFISSVSAGKRGLAWPWYNGSLNPAKLNDGSGTTVAIYDWETYAPPTSTGKNGGLGFIGMQATKDSSSSPVAQLAARQAAQGWATVFSLNEPDINGITPSDAATWYKKWINPLNIKKALPAVTNSAASGQGLDWLQKMINACGSTCYADYINLHWYGTSFADFKAHVTQAHNQFSEFKIVISEFALQKPAGGQSAQIAFYKQAFAWLDAQDYVQLYFPFVATSPALMQQNDPGAVSTVGTGSCLYNNDGSISAVGQLML
ncbi:hypothetical protein DL93DRAFT_1774574 [Clavulina sp. PMI_390]|nr:hypothetical protein DL93DRAFT_1774574 [Clavulina sp. PMI_390]